MRKTYCPQIACLFALVLVLSCAKVTAQTYRILPLGNSITDGITFGNSPSESTRIGYRKELHTLLSNGGYNFDFVGHNNTGYNLFADGDNAGIPGTRGSYLVRLLKDGFDLMRGEQTTPGGQAYLDVFPADIILLHIGTNDIIPTGNDASAIVDILNEIDAWKLRTGSHVTVFIARIINKNPYNPIITEYNNHLISLVSSRGDPSIFLVDMESGAGIDYSTEIGTDGIHPTQVAYDKIGQTWYIHLNSFLSSIPARPSNLTLNGSKTSIELSWYDNSTNETGFEIERSPSGNPGSFELIHTTAPNVRSFTDNGLGENSTYFYRIRSINLTGPSLYTDIENTTTSSSALIPPSDLAAISLSSNSIELTWTDNSDNETGFTIERSLNSGSGFSFLTTTSANMSSYIDEGLTEGTEYVYRSQATDGDLPSEYSNESSAVTRLIAPSVLLAEVVNKESIFLSWSDNSDNESAYIIERSIDNGFDTIHIASSNTNYYTDESLTEGTEYKYRVRASSSKANSTYSNEASATTHLFEPTELLVTPLSESSVHLAWTDNSDTETRFIIERSTTEASGFNHIADVPTNVVSFDDEGLADGRLYYYRIRATNDLVLSAYSNTSSAATILAPPSELLTSTLSEHAIGLNWVDNSSSEDSYSIERSSGSNSEFVEIQSVSGNKTTYTDDDLNEGTRYLYRIKGKQGTESSGYSNISSSSTNLEAPTNLEALELDNGSVGLSWIDNSENETVYLVERTAKAETSFLEISVLPANTVSYTDEESNSLSQYIYRVKASNGSQFSAYSNEAEVAQGIPLSDSLFSFYPNPSNGNITIVLKKKGDNEYSDCYMRIADFSGRVHYMLKLETSDTRQIEIFNLKLPNSLTNGFYSLSLIFDGRSVSEKFILMK